MWRFLHTGRKRYRIYICMYVWAPAKGNEQTRTRDREKKREKKRKRKRNRRREGRTVRGERKRQRVFVVIRVERK